MSRLLAAEACKFGTGCEFPAPGVDEFMFAPLFSFTVLGYQVDFTKPMLFCVIATIAVAALVMGAFARPSLVPRGFQNFVEWFYDFIRFEIARDVIGKNGMKWAPYLATLFLFVFVLNLFEIIPGVHFPVNSHIAYPIALALLTWFIFLTVGVRTHGGPLKYLRSIMFPPGLPKWVYIPLAPMEFFSTILVRPFTLSVRLFANMFAGHLLLLTFTLATFYMAVLGLPAIVSVASGVMTFIMTGFEFIIITLQAYIFTLLTASYIGEALETEH